MFTCYPIRLAAAAALWMAQTQASPAQVADTPLSPTRAAAVPALEPARPSAAASQEVVAGKSANQETADRIAAVIRHHGALRNFTIDIRFQNGLAVLTGQVASPQQRQEVVLLVGSVPGVQKIQDQLQVAPGPAVVPAQALSPGPGIGPLLRPGPDHGPLTMPPMPSQEPMPVMQMPPGPHPTQPPPLPPYAWPTFAPYNNYSRVATPTLNPYQSWPNIGPMYPFPKIPLGWRSVTLTWYDGHWWYGKKASGHDWWRVRYW